MKNVLAQYSHADLFLHSPLDSDAYKFSLLKDSPRVTAVKIFQPRHIVETNAYLRLLTPKKSPKGLQVSDDNPLIARSILFFTSRN
jgi:hypothetical protein